MRQVGHHLYRLAEAAAAHLVLHQGKHHREEPVQQRAHKADLDGIEDDGAEGRRGEHLLEILQPRPHVLSPGPVVEEGQLHAPHGPAFEQHKVQHRGQQHQVNHAVIPDAFQQRFAMGPHPGSLGVLGHGRSSPVRAGQVGRVVSRSTSAEETAIRRMGSSSPSMAAMSIRAAWAAMS